MRSSGEATPLQLVQAGLTAMTTTDPTTLPDEQVRSDLLAWLTAFNQLAAVIAGVVGTFDARSLSETDACRTTRTWLQAFTRMSQGAASGWLGRAKLLRELPALAAACGEGRVSVEHVAKVRDLSDKIGVAAVKDHDAVLADLAARANPQDVAAACERIRAHVDPDGPAPDPLAAFERRGITIARSGSMFAVRGQLDPEGAAVLMTALDAVMKPPAPDDLRTAAQRRADAIVDLTRLRMTTGSLPTVGGVRPQLGLLITPQNLLSDRHTAAPDYLGAGPAGSDTGYPSTRTPTGGTTPPGTTPPGTTPPGTTPLGTTPPGTTPPGTTPLGTTPPGTTPPGTTPPGTTPPAAGPPGATPDRQRVRGCDHTQGSDPAGHSHEPNGDGDAASDDPAPSTSHARHRDHDRPGAPPPHRDDSDPLGRMGVPPLPEAPWLNWVGEVPPELAQRLACDCDVWRAILDPTTGLPLEVGRAHRLVPTWIRKALHARDRGCRWPGCDAPVSWTDAHHLWAWYFGGETNVENLVCLCRYHHVRVHEGHWRLALDPTTGEVRVWRPEGTPYELGPSQPFTGPNTRRGDPRRQTTPRHHTTWPTAA